MSNKQKVFLIVLMIILLTLVFILLILFKGGGREAEFSDLTDKTTSSSAPKPLEKLMKGFNLKTPEQKEEEILELEQEKFNPLAQLPEKLEEKKLEETSLPFLQKPVDPELENKIFETLLPSWYRDKLSYFQDLLTDEKFIKESERVSFQNKEEVFGFIRKSYQYLKDNKIIDPKDADRFLTYGFYEWKRLLEMEEGQLRRGELPLRTSSSIKSFKYSSVSSSCNTSPFSIFASLISKLIPGKKVRAFYVCTPIECWQTGAGVGPIPGKNLIAPCCCCYCGKVPCGCLNAVCVGRNAIWDPVTHICGCDT